MDMAKHQGQIILLFSASNPGILYGGFLMESKKAIYDILPAGYYPKTLLFKAGTDCATVMHQIKQQQFRYPLIGKPDIGAKGEGVQKLMNDEEVSVYASRSDLDFLIQEFSPFKQEVGIFYYRYPGQDKGAISGIVRKEFLSVSGDGISTIRQLCEKEKDLSCNCLCLKNLWATIYMKFCRKELQRNLFHMEIIRGEPNSWTIPR